MFKFFFISTFLSLTAIHPQIEQTTLQILNQDDEEIEKILNNTTIKNMLKEKNQSKSKFAKAYFALGAGAGLVMVALLYASFYGYAEYQHKQQIKITLTPDPENTEIPEEQTEQTKNQQQTEEPIPVSDFEIALQGEQENIPDENEEHIDTEQKIIHDAAQEQERIQLEQREQIIKNINSLKSVVLTADDQIINLQKKYREAESDDEKKKLEQEIQIADEMRIKEGEKRLEQEEIKRKKAFEQQRVQQNNYFGNQDNDETPDNCIIS